MLRSNWLLASAELCGYRLIIFSMFCTRNVSQTGLLSPSKYTTKMSCSDNPAGNSFLVDSLISARAEGSTGSYYQSTGIYLPPGSEYSYGLPNCGYFPGFKRSEGSQPQTMVPTTSSPYTQPGMDAWLEASRSCRLEQTGNHPGRSFSPSIKEESAYCLYESEKGPKDSVSDGISYSRVTPDSCPVSHNGTVPVPGYFRLSQTYTTSKCFSELQSNSSHFPPPRAACFDPSPSASPARETVRRESDVPAAGAPCTPARDKEMQASPAGASSSPEPVDSPADTSGKANKSNIFFSRHLLLIVMDRF